MEAVAHWGLRARYERRPFATTNWPPEALAKGRSEDGSGALVYEAGPLDAEER